MFCRRALALFLILAVFLLVQTMPAHGGQGDEVLLGLVFGTSFGLLFSGSLLILYTNPESDMNIETMMIAGGMIGATGGIIFGSLLPDDAVERDPVVSFKEPKGNKVKVYSPTVSIAPFAKEKTVVPGIRANLLNIQF